MKRKDIGEIPIDYYSEALRFAQYLQTIENGNQVELGILNKKEANKRWAAIYDIQQLFIYLKRAGISIEELQEWAKNARTIRQALKPAPKKKQKRILY